MIVRLTAVVLRLSALYFLWWALSLLSTYQFILTSDAGPPIFGFILTVMTSLLIAALLWVFARRLAPLFCPYEVQNQVSTDLDVDKLEEVMIQIVGLVLVLIGLHDILVVFLSILTATIDHGYALSGGRIIVSLTSGAVFSLFGFILLLRMRGVLKLLSRMRKLGVN